MLNLEFIGARAVLTLDRPPANAINDVWLARFHEALDAICARPQTAVVHLRSATRMFCAGADLHLMAGSIESAAGADAMLAVVALCGASVAKRLILGGETVHGAEAVTLGLAQWSAPAAQLPALAQQKAQALASLPAAALASCKRCIDLASPPQPAGYLKELVETRRLYGSEPTRTLVQQFISKRKS
jgi:enoyl-CoA hydratase/carnithine racemase